jgi:hypothetical protein
MPTPTDAKTLAMIELVAYGLALAAIAAREQTVEYKDARNVPPVLRPGVTQEARILAKHLVEEATAVAARVDGIFES